MAEVRADSGLTAVGEELRIALIDRYLEGEMPDRPSARRRLTGLLSEVVPKGTALERAREIARKLAAKSPIVMKIGRDAFMRAVEADFRRSVENAAESFALVATTEDCQEGLNAFVEKRTPNYRGR